MSHEIWELDNPMYGSRVPDWHGLGTVLDGQLTSAEAIAAAHLDWDVHLEPVVSAENSEADMLERGCF